MKMKHAIMAAFMLCMGVGVQAQTSTENNWFIQGQAGASYSLGSTGIGKLISPAGQIAVGKYFTPAVGARLAISGWRGRAGSGSTPASGFYYGAATVDGLFNMSTLFCGKNPERFFNTSLIVGAGYNQTFDEGASSFMARVGLQASFRLNKAFDFNVEALANGVSDRWNRKDDHKFDSYYNVLVGITYKFGTGFNLKCPDCKPVVYKNKSSYNETYVKSLNDKINQLQSEIDNHKCPEPQPCPEVETVPGVKSHVSFGLAKTNIAEDQLINILAIADYMKQYPQSKAVITGYADKGTGTSKINEELARKRAHVVADELINKYGISANRLVVDSKGSEVQPFSTNDWNRVVIMVAE